MAVYVWVNTQVRAMPELHHLTGRDRSWLSAAEVDELVRARHAVVVQSFEGPMRWLTPPAAQEEWTRARQHFLQPGAGGGGAMPDARGRVYPGIAWRREGQVLVGLQEDC